MTIEAPNTGAPPAGGTTTPPPTTAPAPATTAPETSVPWAGAQGIYNVKIEGKETPWWNAVPEQPVRDFMEAKQYRDPATAAVALYNLNKLQNGAPDVVALPGKDADPKAWDSFYSKLGRPEKAEGYDLKFGADVAVHDGALAVGKEIFHMLGAPPEKAQAAANKWNGFVAQQAQAQADAARAQNEQALTALQTQWGKDLDANKAAGQRVLQAMRKEGLTEDDLAAVENSIGSAAVVKMLAIIGKRTAEGTFSGGSGSPADPSDPSQMSKEQAATKIASLQGDAAFMAKYTDSRHPEHTSAVKLMEALFAR